jgi:hypothetical protein
MASPGEPMDLALSSILPPQAQNHDRHSESGSDTREEDEEEEEVEDDVMDTTPDGTHSPNSPAHVVESSTNDGDTQAGAVRERQGSPDSADPVDENSTSEDYDEDYEEDWHEIPEDTSVPSEQELKDFFTGRTEPSATDFQYFEDQLVKDFDDPEYRVGTTGRAEFTITKFNGTTESPQKELLLRSSPFQIGTHSFAIKVFPRGNGTDYLSIFVECVSMGDDGGLKEQGRYRSRSRRKSKKDSSIQDNTTAVSSAPLLHTPLPLRNAKKEIQQRPAVVADIIMVAYNPKDPRVFVKEQGMYRFSSKSQDWGWPRFVGPFYELGKRQHGKRAPLLQDDKMSFTAYVRIIDDDTGSYRENPTPMNPWDSFIMTGLQAMTTVNRFPRALVPAVSTWMLLKPFRKLLYDTPMDDVQFENPPRPMLMALKIVLYALRTLDPLQGGNTTYPPVSLQQLEQAFIYYGLQDVVLKCDVIELWEVMRTKLEEEMSNTPFEHSLEKLFGPKVDRTSPTRSFRVPVKGIDSMQKAIDQTPSVLPLGIEPPMVLNLELERQHFDEIKRSWEKLNNKITIDNHVTVGGKAYTLYGIITHDRDLQSGLYSSVLRPNGPQSGWFQYTDKRYPEGHCSDKLVQRLTQREAIDQHQGGFRKTTDIDPCLAYIVIYVCDDIAIDSFNAQTEPYWNPVWIDNYQQTRRTGPSRGPPGMLSNEMSAASGALSQSVEMNTLAVSENKTQYQVRALSSKMFEKWQGPGITKLPSSSHDDEHMHEFLIPTSATLEQLREKIAEFEPEALHSVQIKVWHLVPTYGQRNRPSLDRAQSRDDLPFGGLSRIAPLEGVENEVLPVWCWYHVHDPRDLNVLLKDDEARKKRHKGDKDGLPENSSRSPEVNLSGITPQGQENEPVPTDSSSSARTGQQNRLGEDTIMSDPEDPTPPAVNMVFDMPPGTRLPPPTNTHSGPPHPGSLGFPPPQGLFRHPPPPGSLVPVSARAPQPPPPWANYMQATLDNPEVYFFLKIWDPEKQLLFAHGTSFARYKDRIDHTVFKCLGVSRDHSRPIWTERSLSSADLVKRRKTFEDLKLGPGCIIVIRAKASEINSSEEDYYQRIFESGGFLDLQSYLRALARDVAFPDRTNPNSIYTLDYFGQEYYKGSLRSHEPHGEGVKIYFSGDKYTGNFKLGERHGSSGVLKYINGDIYSGSFARDQYSGQGRWEEAQTGNVYQGGWLEGRPYGEGVTHWKQAEKGTGLCSICWDEMADAVLLNCGHIVGCLACSKRVEYCPVCRKKVISAIKFYRA